MGREGVERDGEGCGRRGVSSNSCNPNDGIIHDIQHPGELLRPVTRLVSKSQDPGPLSPYKALLGGSPGGTDSHSC